MSLPNARWMGRFAIGGCLIALCLLAMLEYGSRLWSFETHYRVLSVSVVVWPSSVFLLATCGHEDTLQGWIIVAISVGANAVPYALLGGIASVFRPRRPSGQGQQ
jgi:hypothetical protein